MPSMSTMTVVAAQAVWRATMTEAFDAAIICDG
jgi:hypothetical protein